MGWIETKLSAITLKIASGSTPRGGKESYKKSGITLIRSLNIYDFDFKYKDLAFIDDEQARKLSNVIIEENDILLNITGASVGRCNMVPNHLLPARINQHIMIIRIDQRYADAKFILYMINSPQYKMSLMSLAETGATREALTKDDISNFKINLPSLKTQQKIASILSNYDKLIENNTQRIKLLESMAEELYKEWFVRFRFPGYEDVEIVDGLPVGWERKSIFDISEIVYGYPLKSTLFNDESKGIPLIRIRDIKNNFSKIFTEEIVDNEKYFLRNGDLLVGMDGDFHMGIWSGGHAILNQRVVCFRPKENISKYFFYFAIKKDIDFLNQVISGTTVAHLSDRDLKKINLSVPDENTMNKFKILIDNIFEIKIKLDVKNKNLKQTRDLLLPRLMSGKLNVEDLDII